jgi:hypothetical protein
MRIDSLDFAGNEIIDEIRELEEPEVGEQILRIDVSQVFGIVRSVVATYILRVLIFNCNSFVYIENIIWVGLFFRSCSFQSYNGLLRRDLGGVSALGPRVSGNERGDVLEEDSISHQSSPQPMSRFRFG